MPNRATPSPFVIVADDAFPLKNYILKPYPRSTLWDLSKRVFNYRLSRARRTVENAFGILASRFRIFYKPIHLSPSKVENIVLACCALHNYLSAHPSSRRIYRAEISDFTCDPNPEGWYNFVDQCARAYAISAKLIRDEFANYFINEGSVPWQWNI